MSKDACTISAPVYDLLSTSFHPGQVAALEKLIPLVRAKSGSVSGIEAGSSLDTALVLERLPEARVYALEPSIAMRALVLTKVAAHPEWFDWVTTRPRAFGTAPLPDAISAAVPLSILGHFNPDRRAAPFAVLAARLPEGGAVLAGLQPPCQPARVESYEIAGAQIGDLTYSDLAEGWPFGDEHTQWKMACHTLDGDRVLAEETTEYLFCHPNPEVTRTELHATGLSLNQIENTTFYLIVRG